MRHKIPLEVNGIYDEKYIPTWTINDTLTLPLYINAVCAWISGGHFFAVFSLIAGFLVEILIQKLKKCGNQ